jgi:hypothetical protein
MGTGSTSPTLNSNDSKKCSRIVRKIVDVKFREVSRTSPVCGLAIFLRSICQGNRRSPLPRPNMTIIIRDGNVKGKAPFATPLRLVILGLGNGERLLPWPWKGSGEGFRSLGQCSRIVRLKENLVQEAYLADGETIWLAHYSLDQIDRRNIAVS